MSSVLRTEISDDDLEEIGLYIAREHPDRANTFIDEIVATYDTIAAQPRMGRERPELAANLRSHPHGRYVILYRIMDAGIEIVRVLHGSRDIPSLFPSQDL